MFFCHSTNCFFKNNSRKRVHRFLRFFHCSRTVKNNKWKIGCVISLFALQIECFTQNIKILLVKNIIFTFSQKHTFEYFGMHYYQHFLQHKAFLLSTYHQLCIFRSKIHSRFFSLIYSEQEVYCPVLLLLR